MLVLGGKNNVWFRLHCYLCGAWMEVQSNCTTREITYSTDRPALTVPLPHSEGCKLWRAGSNEETKKKEEEYDREVKEVEAAHANQFAFGDTLLPTNVSDNGKGEK